MNGKPRLLVLLTLSYKLFLSVEAFLPALRACRLTLGVPTENSALAATSEGGKKKRRRRKQVPSSSTPESSGGKTSESPPTAVPQGVDEVVNLVSSSEVSDEDVDISLIKNVANFKFQGDDDGGLLISSGGEASTDSTDKTAIPLPDIKEALRKKEIEAEMARMEEEQMEKKVKIKRGDKEALLKLLEQQPYADADDSFFEEEEYGTVSALLGERAKPFLGIPSGPLQVGHFIGALVIVLMAFIEYPGFPLTNLPSLIRAALQGGLGTVYAINLVLALLAVFKAGERGQPAFLWVAKTFTVGGLAFDQLTQLPTLEEVEEVKSRKGKRALKNRKKK